MVEEIMNKPDTFDITDGGLNKRLNTLVGVLDATNATLQKVSADLIDANERQSRKQNKFQIIYLVLTFIIVIAASLSTYFAYKSIEISSGQKSIQTVQVILETIAALGDTLEALKPEIKKTDENGRKQSKKEETMIDEKPFSKNESSQTINKLKSTN